MRKKHARKIRYQLNAILGTLSTIEIIRNRELIKRAELIETLIINLNKRK